MATLPTGPKLAHPAYFGSGMVNRRFDRDTTDNTMAARCRGHVLACGSSLFGSSTVRAWSETRLELI